MKTLRLLLCALLIAPMVATAGEDGGRPGAFLDYAASARSLGMGQAFTAIANDPSAVYWNPSAIASFDNKALVAQFSTLMDDASYGFVGYTNPLPRNTGFGLGFVNLQSGTITRRDAAGNQTGSFDATSNAIFLSGSMNPVGELSFGSTAKLVREAVDGDSAMALGLDLGSMYRANRFFQFGLMLRNLVAPSLKLDREEETYPRSVVGGVAYTPIAPLTFGLDLEKPQGTSARVRLGASYSVNVLALRAGVSDSEFTAGVGVGMGSWNFDYALGYARASADIRELGSFHRFGVQFNFANPAPLFNSRPSSPAVAGGKTPTSEKIAPSNGKDAAALKSRSDKNLPAKMDLENLGTAMDTWDGKPTPEIQAQVDAVAKHLKRGRYLRPAELYAAQGYISYFTGEYSRSVRSLEESLKTDPADKKVAARLRRVQLLTVRRVDKKRETPEIRAVRESFEKGDYAGTIVLAQRLLESSPGNVAAESYLSRSYDRLVLPYIKKAKEFLDKDRLVESFVQFQKVLDYAPENAEAKAYSERLVRVIEKKSDMDYLSRSAPKSDASVTQGIAQYQKGLRLYAHGETAPARTAWDAAVVHLKAHALLQDSVRSTIIELSR